MDGITNDFDIDISELKDLSRPDVRNLPTSIEQKIAVSDWIKKQRDKGALWGPFAKIHDLPPPLENIRVSPIGAVPKGDHFGKKWNEKKWRVIHHLSHPRSGDSVNSEISPEFKAVSYVKFREVVQMINNLGPKALLWTIDAKDAYLRLPIKQHCWKYMGLKWMGKYYAFTHLCFGLASACRIYTRFADFILQIIQNNSDANWWTLNGLPTVYHYIDDFFGGAPESFASIAHAQYSAVFNWFIKLGIPTQGDKCVKPTTQIKILGFIYNTVTQTVSIPLNKLQHILREINRILKRGKATQLELLSLIGKLRWASVCIFAGPAFVRRMEKAAYSVKRASFFINIKLFEKDLIWWKKQIIHGGNGISFSDILRPRDQGDIHVLTDASTGIGMGGWNHNGNWFRYRWTDHPRKSLFANPKFPDIYWKEMCAIATSCMIWSKNWNGKSVTFWCDNDACVHSLAKRKCDFNRNDVMDLIRIIANLANKHNFQPYFIHIRGKDNLTADALSRFDLDKFKSDICGIAMDNDETPCEIALDSIIDCCFTI